MIPFNEPIQIFQNKKIILENSALSRTVLPNGCVTCRFGCSRSSIWIQETCQKCQTFQAESPRQRLVNDFLIEVLPRYHASYGPQQQESKSRNKQGKVNPYFDNLCETYAKHPQNTSYKETCYVDNPGVNKYEER